MCSVGGSIGWSRCTAWALATQHMDPCTPSRALLTCPLPPIQTPRLPPAGSRRRGAGAVKQATGASGQRLKGAALVCSWQHLEEWGPPASRPQFKPSPCAGAPPPPTRAPVAHTAAICASYSSRPMWKDCCSRNFHMIWRPSQRVRGAQVFPASPSALWRWLPQCTTRTQHANGCAAAVQPHSIVTSSHTAS